MSIQDLDGLLVKLGIPADESIVCALFALFDREKNGSIDFSNFNRFVVYDPYP